MAQMKSCIGGEPRFQQLDCCQDRAGILNAAQARLPRARHTMEHGGDAVSDRLSVAVYKGNVERDINARARHDLPLTSVAMNVDNARQQQEPSGVQRADARTIRTNRGNKPVVRTDMERRILEAAVEQYPRSNNTMLAGPAHATAVRPGSV